MRVITLIFMSLGSILINGCAKENYEQNDNQITRAFLRNIQSEGETPECLIHTPTNTILIVPSLLL